MNLSVGGGSVTRSKCRTCGEKLMDTGNFQIKIVKAKPIPMKIRKLVKTGKLDESKKDILKQTKFGRFLLKRADQASNAVEITCGQCSSSCQIVTKKPTRMFPQSPSRSPAVLNSFDRTSSPSSFPSEGSKRRKRRNKEVNAGLFIPTPNSMDTTEVNNSPSTYEFKSDTPQNANHSKSVPPVSKPVVSKEKEMDNLRKVLFKSKKKGQQGTVKTSLKDFLSSM